MIEMKKLFDKTFVRFILVGVCNTAVGTTVMLISYNVFHVDYWVSSALNYIIGSIVSYFLNKSYTFQYKKKSNSVLLRFVLNIILCYLIAYGFAKPFIYNLLQNQSTRIRDNVAMLTGTVLFTIINYFGQKKFVFETNIENS